MLEEDNNEYCFCFKLTTFEPKRSKQQACNAKAQKGVDRELELELEETIKCAGKQRQWASRRELTD